MYLLFNNAIDEYYNYSKLHLKSSTYEEQKRKVNLYILKYFNNKNIYDINLIDIIKWKEYINTFNFKYNYKSYLYYTLSSIFDFLLKYYNIEKNFVKLEGNFKNNDIQCNGNIWNIDEFKKFINVIDNLEYKIIFELLYFSGMRKGELLSLKWCDIDFINNKININKTITRNHELLPPKTKSSNRIITINNNIINELKIYYNNNDINELIFNISFTQLKRIKDNYCKIANVKQIKIHEFRHSHACLLFKNDIDIEDISYRLGHSNINMTLTTYLKYLPKNEKRVIKLLNSIC